MAWNSAVAETVAHKHVEIQAVVQKIHTSPYNL